MNGPRSLAHSRRIAGTAFARMAAVVGEGDVSADEDERPNFCRLERHEFEPAVADAFVPGQHDPLVRSDQREPFGIGSALGKMGRQPLDADSCLHQRFVDRIAVERLVEEKR